MSADGYGYEAKVSVNNANPTGPRKPYSVTQLLLRACNFKCCSSWCSVSFTINQYGRRHVEPV